MAAIGTVSVRLHVAPGGGLKHQSDARLIALMDASRW